jgi:hypothetical protein
VVKATRRIPADFRTAGIWLIVLGAIQAPLWLMNLYFWATSTAFFVCGAGVLLGSRLARGASQLLCLTMEILLLSAVLNGPAQHHPPLSPSREFAGTLGIALCMVAFGVPIFLSIRGLKAKAHDGIWGNCEYDLRGLAHGPCPECGADIPGDQRNISLDSRAHHHRRLSFGYIKKSVLHAFAAILIVAAVIVAAVIVAEYARPGTLRALSEHGRWAPL